MERFSKVYAAFDQEFAAGISAITADKDTRIYGVGAGQLKVITAVLMGWRVEYTAYQVPTSSSQQVEKTRESFKTSKKAWNKIKQQIKNDGRITATIIQKALVGLTPDGERRQHVYTPTDPIQFTILKNVHLAVTVEVSIIQLNGEFDKLGLPKDVTGVQTQMAYINIGDPAPKPSDYQASNAHSRARFEIKFIENQIGMLCYLKGNFINARDEPGLLSEPVIFIIN